MKKKYCLLIAFISVVQFLCAQKIKENNKYKQKKEPTTFLGVDVDNVGTRTNGLYVNGVIRGYGAEKAGLKIADTLKTINGDTVHTFFELAYLLQKYQPQQQVELLFIRNNSLHKTIATVSEFPEYLKYDREQALAQLEGEGPEREVKKAKLGISVKSLWERYAVEVTEFTKNSPAEKAGLKIGDIILKMDAYEFPTMEELKYYLSKYKPGDIVTLLISSGNEQKYIKVPLGEEIIYVRNKNK